MGEFFVGVFLLAMLGGGGYAIYFFSVVQPRRQAQHLADRLESKRYWESELIMAQLRVIECEKHIERLKKSPPPAEKQKRRRPDEEDPVDTEEFTVGKRP